MKEKEVLVNFVRHSENLHFFICCPGDFHKKNIGFSPDIKGFLSDLSNFLQVNLMKNKPDEKVLKMAIHLLQKAKLKFHGNHFFFYFPTDFSEEELDYLYLTLEKKSSIKNYNSEENSEENSKNDEKYLISRLAKSLKVSTPIFYNSSFNSVFEIYGDIEIVFSELHSFLLELCNEYFFAPQNQKEQKLNNIKTMTKILKKFSCDFHVPSVILYLTDVPFTQEEIDYLTSSY